MEESKGSRADICITGNLGIVVPFSGTCGAASAAADQLDIPGVAFSGDSGEPTSFRDPTPSYSLVYADLAVNLTTTLLDATPAGQQALPPNTWLNVNFPAAGDGTSCPTAASFRFVLSRIYPAIPFITKDDVETCGNDGRLPTERSVVGKGCFVSVSVGRGNDKLDQGEAEQAVVLERLGRILSCLP